MSNFILPPSAFALRQNQAIESGIVTEIISDPELEAGRNTNQAPPMGGGAGINDVLRILDDPNKKITERIDKAVQQYRQDRDAGVIYPFSAIIKARPRIWAWLVQVHREEIAKALLTAGKEKNAVIKKARIEALLREAYEDVEANLYSWDDLKGEIVFAAHGKGDEVGRIKDSLLDKIDEYRTKKEQPAEAPKAVVAAPLEVKKGTKPILTPDKDMLINKLLLQLIKIEGPLLKYNILEFVDLLLNEKITLEDIDGLLKSNFFSVTLTPERRKEIMALIEDTYKSYSLIEAGIDNLLPIIQAKEGRLEENDMLEFVNLLIGNEATLEDIHYVLNRKRSSNGSLKPNQVTESMRLIEDTYFSRMVAAVIQTEGEARVKASKQAGLLHSFWLAIQTKTGSNQQLYFKFKNILGQVDQSLSRLFDNLNNLAKLTQEKEPPAAVSPAEPVTKKAEAPVLKVNVNDKERLIREAVSSFLNKFATNTKRPLAEDDIKEFLTLLLQNTVTIQDIQAVLRKYPNNSLISERMAAIIGFIKETYLSIMMGAYAKAPDDKKLKLLDSFRLATETSTGGDKQLRLQLVSTLREKEIIPDKWWLIPDEPFVTLRRLTGNQGPAQGLKGARPSGGVGIGVVADHIINAFKTKTVKESAAQIWPEIQGDINEGLYRLADLDQAVREKLKSEPEIPSTAKTDILNFIYYYQLSLYPSLPRYPTDDNYHERSFLNFCNEKLAEGTERERMNIILPPEVIFNENIIGWAEALLDLTKRQTKTNSGIPQFKIIVPVSDFEVKKKIENLHLPGVLVLINPNFAKKSTRELIGMILEGASDIENKANRIGTVLPPTVDTDAQVGDLENEQFYCSVLKVASSEQREVISAFNILEDLAKRMNSQDAKKVNIIAPIQLPEDLYKELDLYFEKIKYLGSQV